MKQPLEDIKVLDLSRVYAGPGGSMILGDLGADVIRIESPEGTDSMREWTPIIDGESTYYMCANRNKQSVTLNLKHEKGKEILLQLVKDADVVLENFKTGTLDRMGLGYEDLKKVNPSIILCSVTGYGQTGPFSEEPGFDPVIQAIGGLMSLTGDPTGDSLRVGLPVVDIMTCQYVAISIISAIRLRDHTSTGQHIDISLFDVQVSSLANAASSYLNAGSVQKRIGNSHSYIVPYQVFQCKDRPLMVCAGNERLYKKLCDLLGHAEWAEDERYSTNDKRIEHREELTEKIQKVFYEKTADEWFEILSEAKVPAGPVNSIDQVFKHPQVIARDSVEEIPHPTLGKIKMVKSPMRFSELGVSTKHHPPLLGENTMEFYEKRLGLEKAEIKRLREEGVI